MDLNFQRRVMTYSTGAAPHPLVPFIGNDPSHAGAFGANDLDASFGPRFEYLRAPSTEGFTIQNLPPPHLQSFGAAEVTKDGRLAIRIHDVTGAILFEKVLQPK